MELYKICTKCGEHKNVSEFSKSKKGKMGYEACCKICSRIYYEKNKEELKLKADMKKTQKAYEFMKANDDVDWTMFKGDNALNTLRGYCVLYRLVNELQGQIISPYTKDRMKIRIKISDLELYMQPAELKSSALKVLIKLKEHCRENGDTILKLENKENGKEYVAEIKTFDNEIIKIVSNKYYDFSKARKRFYNKIYSNKDFNLISGYKGIYEKVTFDIYGNTFETIPNKISYILNQYESIKNEMLKHNDKFLGISAVNKNGFVMDFEEGLFGEKITLLMKTFNWGKCGFLKSRKETYELLKEKGYNPASAYKGASKHMLVDFNCGHKPNLINPHNLKHGYKCPICASENNSGENHPNWKGGISGLHTYLRDKIKPWKLDTLKKDNYKCVITGANDKNLIVHHLVSFNTILTETLEMLQLPLYDQVNLYTDKELDEIEDQCLKLHYKYGLGVSLTREIHSKFHSIFGKGNNTPKQFDEFKRIYNTKGFL